MRQMTRADQEAVRLALAAINAGRSSPLTLTRRFAVGDGAGAYAVESGSGARMVLKWWPNSPVQRANRALRGPRIERLRGLGWPIPGLLESGETTEVLYELWEWAPGQPGVNLVPARVVEQAGQLIESARGAALGDGADWPGWIAGFIQDAIDRAASRAGPEGLAVLDACWQYNEACTLPGGRDIIHGDFTPANCLVDNGRIVAVVDFDECRDGDGSLDLFGVAWDLEGWEKADAVALDRLWTGIWEMTTPEHRRVFAAFWIAGSMGWAAGTEDEDHVVQTALRVFARLAAG
jgi:hypothetical protein